MFDSNLLRGETVDLDVSTVWLAAWTTAQREMNASRGAWYDVLLADSEGPFCYAPRFERQSQLHRDAARAIMSPFRKAFELRTILEREQAEHVVKIGAARFVEPACADETCDACDRPLWWHIDLDVGGRLCPYGREYWAFARAIWGCWTPGHRDGHRQLCASIAGGTRRAAMQPASPLR